MGNIPVIIYFYHYTSEEGKNAILNSGVIYQSQERRGDAVFGAGVYGTRLSPIAGRDYLARNNWDDGLTPTVEMLNKLKWAFEIKIPVQDVKQASGPRDILIYPGDLWLVNYEWNISMVPDNSCIIL